MKIGLYGATGSLDFGDYAMACMNLRDLSALFPDAEFVIFTPNLAITKSWIDGNAHLLPENISVSEDNLSTRYSSFLGNAARVLSSFILKKDVHSKWIWDCVNANDLDFSRHHLDGKASVELRSCDLLIFNGGGYMQNGWGSNVVDFASFACMASRLGIPVFWFGNSFGPLDESLLDCTVRALESSDCVVLRDGFRRSKRLLDEATDNISYVIGTDDLYYQFNSAPGEKANNVVIEIMKWVNRHPSGANAVLRDIASFAHEIIREGYDVTLINLDNQDKVANDYIDEISSMVGHSSALHVITNPLNVETVFDLYRECCFSISFKYHPVVFALASGKPALSFICDDDGYYEGKMHGIYESLGLSPDECVLTLAELNKDTLYSAFINRRSKTQDEEVKKHLHDIREELFRMILGLTESRPKADRNSK